MSRAPVELNIRCKVAADRTSWCTLLPCPGDISNLHPRCRPQSVRGVNFQGKQSLPVVSTGASEPSPMALGRALGLVGSPWSQQVVTLAGQPHSQPLGTLPQRSAAEPGLGKRPAGVWPSMRPSQAVRTPPGLVCSCGQGGRVFLPFQLLGHQ